jgi:tetratricopeptide (TPR) repeat protein
VREPSSADRSSLFLDARNKKHYRLQNAQNFINFLNKAIDINKNPVYLAARALGYMTLKQYERAEMDFSAAQRLAYSNDAMDSNWLLNTLSRKQEPREEVLTQELHNRKTEYILGLCKVLEKKRRHRELRRCCEELVNREPRNLAFRIALLRAFLKLKDTDAARHELS